MKITYENKNEKHNITIDLKSAYLDNNKVFLNPEIELNGVLKELKRKRIIKEICSSVNYNSSCILVAILNMGILREYDNMGVSKYFNKVTNYE